jgi:hypothetical protein
MSIVLTVAISPYIYLAFCIYILYPVLGRLTLILFRKAAVCLLRSSPFRRVPHRIRVEPSRV